MVKPSSTTPAKVSPTTCRQPDAWAWSIRVTSSIRLNPCPPCDRATTSRVITAIDPARSGRQHALVNLRAGRIRQPVINGQPRSRDNLSRVANRPMAGGGVMRILPLGDIGETVGAVSPGSDAQTKDRRQIFGRFHAFDDKRWWHRAVRQTLIENRRPPLSDAAALPSNCRKRDGRFQMSDVRAGCRR